MGRKVASVLLVTMPLSQCFLPAWTTAKSLSNVGSFSSESNMKFQEGDCGSSTNQKWDVDLYQKHSFVFEYGSSLVELLDPQPGEVILDVGCGSGQLTFQIAERGAQAIGFDADLSMVERAQQQYATVDFFQADAAMLEMPGGVARLVDAIFSNAALHWVRNADAAVACMARVLKPGGRFVVEFGGKGNVDRIVKASNQVLGKPENENYWYFPSIAEYSNLLENHGIEVLSANLYDRPTVLEEGDEGMANWLRMFGGVILNDISPDAREQAVQDIVAKLRTEDDCMFDGENWIADYRRIRIVGRKMIS